MTTRDPQDEQRPSATTPAGSPRTDRSATPPRSGKPPLHIEQARELVALNRREPPGSASDIAGAALPGADALDPDRILELPTRRPAARADGDTAGEAGRQAGEDETPPARIARVLPGLTRAPARVRQNQAAPSTGEPASGPLVSLREAAQPYLARLAGRRGPKDDGEAADRRDDLRQQSVSMPPVCPLCHGAGFVRLDVPVGDKLFGQAVRCECKERELEARERQKMRDLSSLKPFDKKGFDMFDAGVPGVAEAYEVARRYAEDPNGWLILQGGYGCGKTHLAAAIARTREEAGETVFFSIVPDLLDHLRATFAPASEITYDELFDRVRHVGLLVLDDLGSENATAWATEKLFQIINYRYNYRLPTVITTNVRLLSHLDDRIRSRLSDLTLVRWVRLDAGDYRERHVGRAGSSGPAGPGGGTRPTRGGGTPRGGPSRNGYGR